MKAWRERRAESREATARLKAIFANEAYAALYAQYEAKLNGDDPYQAWIAKEILLGYSNRDWPRLVRAKNQELLHLEWLPDRRVHVTWPAPCKLSLREWEIIAYFRDNKVYVADENNKTWLFDRRVLSREYHQPGDSYSDPVFTDMVVGFECRTSDYFDFCEERRKKETE